jgi:hypothetical protein
MGRRQGRGEGRIMTDIIEDHVLRVNVALR